MLNSCLLLLALLAAPTVRPEAEPERQAAEIFAQLQAAGPVPHASAQISRLVAALEAAHLSRSATVALSVLAASPSTEVRAAALNQLRRQADVDPGLAFELAARQETLQAPSRLALRVARAHLERALLQAPLEEGSAFEAANASPSPGSLTKAQGPVAPPEPEQPLPAAAKAELALARDLARAAAQAGQDEAESHEVAGLAALAEGDGSAAERELSAAAAVPSLRGDPAAAERRSAAFLQLARLAYARGDDVSAQSLFERVGRSSPQWLEALFDSSWAHFRRGEDEHALGNLMTLHAPFFQGRYFPESFVLKALVLYQNCRYADARKTLAEFDARYRPLHDGLATFLARMPTAQEAYELLAAGAAALEHESGPAARSDVLKLAHEPDVSAATQAVAQMAQELDSMDTRSEAFRESALAAQLLPALRKTRLHLLELSGTRLRARVASERSELRELLSQGLRLSFEIAGREKELAEEPPVLSAKAARREQPQLDDDEELWPFQGEYWRDELGSYRFQLGERCRKPRPQTVASP